MGSRQCSGLLESCTSGLSPSAARRSLLRLRLLPGSTAATGRSSGPGRLLQQSWARFDEPVDPVVAVPEFPADRAHRRNRSLTDWRDSMRILFGIMSAVTPVATVAALCDAIGPRHPILIHHDFEQQPGFAVDRPNVAFVPEAVRTGWADWGFTEGILKLVRTALVRDDWDYFQLLSPTCMPIQPMARLEAHFETVGADYLIDGVPIRSEVRLLMSHGWRAYAPAGHWRQRVLRRARRWYLGLDAPMANHDGLSFPTRSLMENGGLAALKARVGLGVTRLAERGVGFRHVFTKNFPCYAGGAWFAASRRGCVYLLANTEGKPLLQFFKGMHMADEMLFPTVFKNSSLRGAPATHYVSRFVEARPVWMDLPELEEALASGRYFARKFPEIVDSEVRLELARRIRSIDAGALEREATLSGNAAGRRADHGDQ